MIPAQFEAKQVEKKNGMTIGWNTNISILPQTTELLTPLLYHAA